MPNGKRTRLFNVDDVAYLATLQCSEDPTHGPLRVLYDEDGEWAPGEQPIPICSECGADAEPKVP